MDTLTRFTLSRLPRIVFGAGAVQRLVTTVADYGRRALLVTGARSHRRLPCWPVIRGEFDRRGIDVRHVTIDGEPSPKDVDAVVADLDPRGIDVVVGFGGGSALDAAKAVAGLIPVQRSVVDYLEGVGLEAPYPGPALPFIAAPTTAGTGSEATKNAVLSVSGPQGFKKSFRDERLVAAVALVDPDLLATCPPHIVAANGMDAVTQLIESYVSTRSTPFTRSLIEPALAGARDALVPLYDEVGDLNAARAQMAYASMISGVCLAQTGLGSVHGLASPLGAFYPIPHGVVCGTLLGASTEANITAMCLREPQNPALDRYRRLAEILHARNFTAREEAYRALIDLLVQWTRALNLPRLCEFGVQEAELDRVVANCRGSSMRTNPISLTDEEVREILIERL